jgi:uncharacterized OB-fold protein
MLPSIVMLVADLSPPIVVLIAVAGGALLFELLKELADRLIFRECPRCGRPVRRGVRECPHCGLGVPEGR